MRMEDKSRGYKIFTFFNYILLTLIAIACLYPFYFVVIASVSDPVELIRHNGLLLVPLGDITFDGYKMVLSNSSVLTGYLNTLIILVSGLCLNLILTVLGAYVL